MKIQLIGGSGTGKSTLAEYTADQLGIKWIDTDTYLWKDDSFTENHPLEKRLALYQKDMAETDSYVASGSIYAWHPKGFQDRDLLVFLSLDESVRLERLRKREKHRNNGKNAWLDADGAFTNDFIEWCKTYWTATDKDMIGTYAAQSHELSLAKCHVLKLDSSCSVEELYAAILQAAKPFMNN